MLAVTMAWAQAAVRTGVLLPQLYAQCGRAGDWVGYEVPFDRSFPADALDKIRIILTPTDEGVDPTDRVVPAVPLIDIVEQYYFSFWARNSDITAGVSAFRYVAVAEVEEGNQYIPICGVTQPQHVSSTGIPGDWVRWLVPLDYAQLDAAPSVVLTPTNTNVRIHPSAAVGIAVNERKEGFALFARNADIGPGDVAFNYLACASGSGPWAATVDSGRTSPRPFTAAGSFGDWQSYIIDFSQPFTSPPTVFATASSGASRGSQFPPGNKVAAQPMVHNVTPYGFTLAARTTDISPGVAAFDWIAIGS